MSSQATPTFSLASDAPLPPLAVCPLTGWSAITLSGDDRKSYLQGQVTCDVVSLEPNQSTLGAHCDAKGKVWNVFRLFHHGDRYAMVQRASAAETALRELKKYAVFSRVDIEQTEAALYGVAGEQAQSWLSQWFDTSADVATSESGTAVKIADQRWLLLTEGGAFAKALEAGNTELTDESLWDLLDIRDALPRADAASQAQHIPQAFNLQAIGGVSFSKGCYTGQETVARAKYRGMNKRALFKVSGPLGVPLSEDAAIERAVGDNWRSAGSLLAQFSFSDGQGCGLIILPNDLEEGTQLRLAEQPEHIWHIEPLPYGLDDE